MERRLEALAIIGSGPAAWTAAIYAARAKLEPVVYEGDLSREMIPGGQLMFTTDIENYPGFPNGITGPELVERTKAQALRFGARIVSDRVERVDFDRQSFRLTTAEGAQVEALSVIVATGARADWLGLPNERRLALSGGGVSACAVCDGALPVYRDKVLAVVGGGDSAIEEALYLTKFARQVILIHRRAELRASRIMAERLLAHPKVRVRWNTRVVDVLGEEQITGLRLEDTVTGKLSELAVGGLFVAIGHTPNTAFLGRALELTPHGYIETAPWRTATSVEGVFAAGDVMDRYFRQAITAAAMGAMAALEAERWLSHRAPGEARILETGTQVDDERGPAQESLGATGASSTRRQPPDVA